MEDLDMKWEKVEKIFEDKIDTNSIDGILFVIGIQELGEVRKFSKQEKINIFHIAICKLLSQYGYYRFTKMDRDGWPHFEKIRDIPEDEDGDILIKKAIIKYLKIEN